MLKWQWLLPTTLVLAAILIARLLLQGPPPPDTIAEPARLGHGKCRGHYRGRLQSLPADPADLTHHLYRHDAHHAGDECTGTISNPHGTVAGVWRTRSEQRDAAVCALAGVAVARSRGAPQARPRGSQTGSGAIAANRSQLGRKLRHDSEIKISANQKGRQVSIALTRPKNQSHT